MRTHRAMTLVELMAALAIVGLLAVATLRVVTRLARFARSPALRASKAVHREALARLLELDAFHAQRLRKVDGGFEIESTARVERPAMALEHRPSTVTYEVRQIGGTPWLCRVQAVANRKETVELVARGVHSIAARDENGKDLPVRGWTTEADTLTVRLDLGENRSDAFVLRRE